MAGELKSLAWPMGGLVENAAFTNQGQGTTTGCLNVRPRDAFDQRQRGGQRQGVSKYFADQVNDSNPIQLMVPAVEALDPAYIEASANLADIDFEDETKGTLDRLDDTWRAYGDTTGEISPLEDTYTIIESAGGDYIRHVTAYLNTNYFKLVYQPSLTITDATTIVFDLKYISTGTRRTVRGGCVLRVDRSDLDNDAANGIFVGIDAGSTDGTVNIIVDPLDGVSNNVTLGTMTFAEDTWYSFDVRLNGEALSVYVDGIYRGVVNLAGTYSSKTGVGLYLESSGAASSPHDSFMVAGSFQVNAGTAPASLRKNSLVAVSGGSVFVGTPSEGLVAAVDGSGVLNTSGRVAASTAFQNTFFCDGEASHYQYMDLATKTVSDWATDVTDGSLPVGSVDSDLACNIMALYRGRVVMAGLKEDPQNWFMSKAGDPFDWDYSPTTPNATQAVAGNNSNAGKVGDVVTALIPIQDDLMLMGGANSLWIMRGDPADGGVIDNISTAIGVVGPRAWTTDTSGNVFFFGINGLYKINASGSTFPELVSRGRLDKRFSSIDTAVHDVVLAYDTIEQGVHIYMVPTSEASASPIHYFWDERTNSFWPDTLPTGVGPNCVLFYDRDNPEQTRLLLGGYDGYIRSYEADTLDDDGTGILSYVRFTPILAAGPSGYATVDNASFILDDASDDVTLRMYQGDTVQAADDRAEAGTPIVFAKVLVGGRTNPARHRVSGGAIILELRQAATAGTSWAFESADIVTNPKNRLHGKHRT